MVTSSSKRRQATMSTAEMSIGTAVPAELRPAPAEEVENPFNIRYEITG